MAALLVSVGTENSFAAVSPRLLLLDAAVVGPDVIAVGERGLILRSSDEGRSWRAAGRPVHATLTALSFAPAGQAAAPTHGWVVGHDACIAATTDGGRTWVKQFQGENLQDSFLDVLALDERHVIAVGAYSLFVETTDGGRTWRRRSLHDEDPHFNRISRSATGALYLAAEGGTLLRSDDAGRTWARLGETYEGSFFGVLPLTGETLLAHGLQGHLFRSTDRGGTWTRVAVPPPVLLATAVRLRTGAVLVAGYAGTLLLSRDDAASFAPLESPTKAIAELIELPGGEILALGETGATVLPPPR